MNVRLEPATLALVRAVSDAADVSVSGTIRVIVNDWLVGFTNRDEPSYEDGDVTYPLDLDRAGERVRDRELDARLEAAQARPETAEP